MHSLLHWATENQHKHADGDAQKPTASDLKHGGRLDPDLIDHILGKTDTVLMREALAVAGDSTNSPEDRKVALENFEMLVEQIDNAANLNHLNMWPSILKLCQDPVVSFQALWIVGTAVQNNQQAQEHCLERGGLEVLMTCLTQTLPGVDSATPQDVKVQDKTLYALSALLRQFPAAVQKWTELDTQNIFKGLLQQQSVRGARLLQTLLENDQVDTSEEPLLASHLHVADRAKARLVFTSNGIFKTFALTQELVATCQDALQGSGSDDFKEHVSHSLNLLQA